LTRSSGWGGNIQKLAARVEALEQRTDQSEKDRAVGAAHDDARAAKVEARIVGVEAQMVKVEAAARVAVAETYAALAERVTRLEMGPPNGGGSPRLTPPGLPAPET
jgi:hypothetical protein